MNPIRKIKCTFGLPFFCETMARPTHKTNSLAKSQQNFDHLFYFIQSRNESEQNQAFSPGTMNRNIRNILGHVYHGQLMMQDGYILGVEGKNQTV
jgi:hypothetical protein